MSKTFLSQKCLVQKIFGAEAFWTKYFFEPDIFGTKFFLTCHYFTQIFLNPIFLAKDFRSYILDFFHSIFVFRGSKYKLTLNEKPYSN